MDFKVSTRKLFVNILSPLFLNTHVVWGCWDPALCSLFLLASSYFKCFVRLPSNHNLFVEPNYKRLRWIGFSIDCESTYDLIANCLWITQTPLVLKLNSYLFWRLILFYPWVLFPHTSGTRSSDLFLASCFLHLSGQINLQNLQRNPKPLMIIAHFLFNWC